MREADSNQEPAQEGDNSSVRASVKALVLDLLQSALSAVNPATAVMRQVQRQDDILKIGDRRYDLNRYDHVYVVGGGKAAAPMAQSIETILGDRLTAGVLNVKYGYTAPTRIITLNQAGHPIPDERGVEGVEHMLHLLANTTERDLVICLISGGGSALMVSPIPGVAMADKRRLTDSLLRSGATINELNIVRKHLSRIKGGNLARFAQPADVVSLILSDVIGNHLDVIASGPTVADSSTFAEAWGILEDHDLIDKVPPAIEAHLRAGIDGTVPETPKEGDPIFSRTYNLVIGSNEIATRAALDRAKEVGLNPMLLSTFVEGEAREVGEVMAAIGKEIVHSSNPVGKPACVVASGETTVTVRGQGRGGRNQELALAAALKIEGLDGVVIVSAATDGSDGPTDAAGAIATGETVRRAFDLGLDPRKFLADNDSNNFFSQLGDLIVLGPTNTNVNDLIFVLVL